LPAPAGPSMAMISLRGVSVFESSFIAKLTIVHGALRAQTLPAALPPFTLLSQLPNAQRIVPLRRAQHPPRDAKSPHSNRPIANSTPVHMGTGRTEPSGRPGLKPSGQPVRPFRHLSHFGSADKNHFHGGHHIFSDPRQGKPSLPRTRHASSKECPCFEKRE
jgi:hypothetical protein